MTAPLVHAEGAAEQAIGSVEDKSGPDLESLLASMPKLTPAEMTSSYDCGTWALLRSLVAALVGKGVLSTEDLTRMHLDVLKTAKSFGDRGETLREDDVKIVANWLDGFAGGVGR